MKEYRVVVPEITQVEYLLEVEDDVSDSEVIELALKGEGAMMKEEPLGAVMKLQAEVYDAYNGEWYDLHVQVVIEEEA